jgi:DnaK suppressor protein
MNQEFLREISDQLQRERRALVGQVRDADENFHAITESRQPERGEEAQEERDWIALGTLEDQQQRQLADIDTALAKIEAGSYGICANCGRNMEGERLRALPTTELCATCADRATAPLRPEQTTSEAAATDSETGATDDLPQSGRLPPELDQLDDDELAAELIDIVREDGQVDMEELQIHARNGVVYLEGAVPSGPEHEILLAILTDIAGVQEIVDNLEIQRLAWERDDRSKNQAAQDVTPGTVPNQEPYGGTDDVVLSQEEGVPYEPPDNPPAPPNRKD